MDIVIIWLMVGAGLIALEAVTSPGIGLFLAGLGAMTAALMIQSGIVDITNYAGQFAWFCAFTTLWAALLWKPLQKFRTSHHTRGPHGQEHIQNIAGSRGVVGKHGLMRGKTGQVAWSGTLMNAVLDEHAPAEFLPEGTTVLIRSVSGTTLSVTPLE